MKNHKLGFGLAINIPVENSKPLKATKKAAPKAAPKAKKATKKPENLTPNLAKVRTVGSLMKALAKLPPTMRLSDPMELQVAFNTSNGRQSRVLCIDIDWDV